MNLISIAWKSIRQRGLASSLTSLSVALGVMLMITVLVINGVLGRMFNQTASGYDLIVGPKGSALQLVLNTVFRVSQPIENLPYQFYLDVKNDPRVAEAVPFALGDVTEEGSFPIVGTVSRYFELPYMPNQQFLIRGKGMGNSFDAIIGATVAETNDWNVGSTFKMVHGGAEGHVHDEVFTIVGVLKRTGTPNDKTVFVNLDGFYMIEGHDKPPSEAIDRLKKFYPNDPKMQALKVEDFPVEKHEEGEGHAHHHHHAIPDILKEVTAVLVIMKGDSYSARVFPAMRFSGELKEGGQAQAANPVREIKWLMDNFIGNARLVLVILTSLIIVVSGIGIFVSIYNSMADRKKEIAIMRALGASRGTVFSIILTESILLCIGGGLLGILLGHGLVFLAAPLVEMQSGVLIDPYSFEPIELVIIPVLIALASLVGFIPGMTAYRTDVAKTLSN